MPGSRRDSVAFTVVVTVLVVLGAAADAARHRVLPAHRGSLLLATALAALPVGPLVGCYLWLDRYEPEPRRSARAGPAVGRSSWPRRPRCCSRASAASSSASPTAAVPGDRGPGDRGGHQGRCSCCSCCGGAATSSTAILDGIVYAGMVGIGFAFVENILYLAAAYNGTDGMGPGGTEALHRTFVVRCLLSPFAHPLFTTFTGIGVGIAVEAQPEPRCASSPRWSGLLSSRWLAHAAWNASTVYGVRQLRPRLPRADGARLPRAASAWPCGSRRSERRMLTAALTDAARRGLLPATDIGWVVDLGARRRSRAYAREVGGPRPPSARCATTSRRPSSSASCTTATSGAPRRRTSPRADRTTSPASRRAGPPSAFPGQVVPTR